MPDVTVDDFDGSEPEEELAAGLGRVALPVLVALVVSAVAACAMLA